MKNWMEGITINLYDIDSRLNELLENSVDPDTGELLIDPEELEALQMERDTKVENIALYIKNIKALAEDIKAEEDNLAARRKVLTNKAERLSSYLNDALAGQPFMTARVDIRYRKSNSLQLDDSFVEWAMANNSELLRYKQPEPDKKAITASLKAGETIPYANIVERLNMTIK